MPVPKNTRYRMTDAGVRLAFAPGSGRVVEARNMDSGATHTPAEFAADRKKKVAAESNKRQSKYMNDRMRAGH